MAKDNEERIKILLRQKQELDKLIAYESKRRALEAEKEMFILQGKEAIKGLNRVNQDLTTLTEEKQKLPEVLKPLLGNIYGDNKDVLKYSINGTWYALRRSSLATFPIYSPFIFDLLKLFERLFESVDNRKDEDE